MFDHFQISNCQFYWTSSNFNTVPELFRQGDRCTNSVHRVGITTSRGIDSHIIIPYGHSPYPYSVHTYEYTWRWTNDNVNQPICPWAISLDFSPEIKHQTIFFDCLYISIMYIHIHTRYTYSSESNCSKNRALHNEIFRICATGEILHFLYEGTPYKDTI